MTSGWRDIRHNKFFMTCLYLKYSSEPQITGYLVLTDNNINLLRYRTGSETPDGVPPVPRTQL